MSRPKTTHETNAIRGVIFSKDRALQLDAVLRSLRLHCQDLQILRLHVLYLATNETHLRQYHELMRAYPEVSFCAQRDFRRDLLSLLSPYAKGSRAAKRFSFLCAVGRLGFPLGSFFDRLWRRSFEQIQRVAVASIIPSWEDNEYVIFLVDDNIFTHPFSLSSAMQVIGERKDCIGFSLRLGRNTTYCYVNDSPQNLPAFAQFTEEILLFDWTQSELDFGYPLEVSSSIYRLRDILPFIAGFAFANPNELEDRMAFRARRFRSIYPYLACYRRSVTFCNPINKVQKVISNRVGENFQYGTDELARRFACGERIRVGAYTNFLPSACHQEVDLVFERIAKE
jgi:hypothetical protein